MVSVKTTIKARKPPKPPPPAPEGAEDAPPGPGPGAGLGSGEEPPPCVAPPVAEAPDARVASVWRAARGMPAIETTSCPAQPRGHRRLAKGVSGARGRGHGSCRAGRRGGGSGHRRGAGARNARRRVDPRHRRGGGRGGEAALLTAAGAAPVARLEGVGALALTTAVAPVEPTPAPADAIGPVGTFMPLEPVRVPRPGDADRAADAGGPAEPVEPVTADASR